MKVIPRAAVLVIPVKDRRSRVFRKGRPAVVDDPVPPEITEAISAGRLIVLEEAVPVMVATEDAAGESPIVADNSDADAASAEAPAPVVPQQNEPTAFTPHRGRGRQRKG